MGVGVGVGVAVGVGVGVGQSSSSWEDELGPRWVPEGSTAPGSRVVLWLVLQLDRMVMGRSTWRVRHGWGGGLRSGSGFGLGLG